MAPISKRCSPITILFHLPVCLLAGLLTGGFHLAQAAAQEIHVDSRQKLQSALNSAKPGTTILIAPGVYQGGLHVVSLRGEQNKPIVVTGADRENPPVFEGGNNGMQISAPAFLELRDIIFEKARFNGLNIDDGGGQQQQPSHHIVLRRLTVRDVLGSGNNDGIKLSGLDQFQVQSCTVERWGKAGSAIDMVGCHDGVINECAFREGDQTTATGVQAKGGSRDIQITYCRFENAGTRAINIGGSTGMAFFRPKPEGYEAKNILVEDCTFLGSLSPVAFVGVDTATVRHNTIVGPKRWVMRILQETRDPSFVPCRNGQFSNNIVVFRSNELNTTVNIGPDTAPETFQFSKNVWFCEDRPDATRRLVRLPVEETDGSYGVDPQLRDPAQGDFRPGEQSKITEAGVRTKER